MNVVIHDLNKEAWDKIKNEYEGFKVISNENNIKPCVGCFGCWVKDPGRCVIKDGNENFGAILGHADRVVVISKYTWGGFSSFVKNVFDRSIGYVLPIINAMGEESHHGRRYDNTINMEVKFYGESFTEENKANATRYVKAICTNLHGKLASIQFDVCDSKEISEENSINKDTNEALEGTILLNCSLRGESSNSKTFLNKLSEFIKKDFKSYNIVNYTNKEDELISMLKKADTIVLGMPLYVDGVPSNVVRIMEKLYSIDKGGKKKIYVVSNMGFFESKQIVNLLSIVKTWCNSIGYTYGGGLAIGAGEMVGIMISKIPTGKGPVKDIGNSMIKLGQAITEGIAIDDIYANSNIVPRGAFNGIANSRFKKQVKANGMNKSDLYRTL